MHQHPNVAYLLKANIASAAKHVKRITDHSPKGPPALSRTCRGCRGPLSRGTHMRPRPPALYGTLLVPLGASCGLSASRPTKNRPAAVATGRQDLCSVCRPPFRRPKERRRDSSRRRKPARTCERRPDSPCRRRRSRDGGRPPRCSGTRSQVRTSALLRRSRTCSQLARKRTSSPC